MSTADKLMTLEELVAIPEDGIDRDLIRGRIRIRGNRSVGDPKAPRNRHHSRTELRIGYLLEKWLEAQPSIRGEVVSGEAGFRLKRNPDTGVGIDVAYVSPEVTRASKGSVYFEGPPVLAVEILSPSDTQEDIDEKIGLYLEMGVAIVWIVNPTFKTVIVYRPDSNPVLFHKDQTIDAEPHLPGFRAEVKDFFGKMDD